MIITSIFLGVITVIIIGLCLAAVTYVDEDENEILELSSNKTFFIMLKIPEECVAEEELPHLLTERNEVMEAGLCLKAVLYQVLEMKGIHSVLQKRFCGLIQKHQQHQRGGDSFLSRFYSLALSPVKQLPSTASAGSSLDKGRKPARVGAIGSAGMSHCWRSLVFCLFLFCFVLFFETGSRSVA
nr:unnamed protein product [Homo sapiens]